MSYSVLDKTPKFDIDDFHVVTKTIKRNTTTKNESPTEIDIQSMLIIGGGMTGRPFEDTMTDEMTYVHISKPAQNPITNPIKTTNEFSINEIVNNWAFDIPTILKDPD